MRHDVDLKLKTYKKHLMIRLKNAKWVKATQNPIFVIFQVCRRDLKPFVIDRLACVHDHVWNDKISQIIALIWFYKAVDFCPGGGHAC